MVWFLMLLNGGYSGSHNTAIQHIQNCGTAEQMARPKYNNFVCCHWPANRVFGSVKTQ